MPEVRAFAMQVHNNLLAAHNTFLESRIVQIYQANKRRRPEKGKKDKEHPYDEGQLVYVSTQNLNLPKGRAHKLMPKYVGPFKVLKS
ncbi:hypothetical protein K474DRAFT_1582819, partial [Panus rudis PR-1116 ss-1]